MDDYYNDRLIDKSEALVRTSVPALDDILGHRIPVLDHGFIRVLDYMGDDHSIDNAARISYGVGTKRKSEAQGLINYLMSHEHTSPFEMCELKIHVKLPIMVMRQWVRQRMASLNEQSARYSVLSNEFYIPQITDMAHQSVVNKQGRGEVLDPQKATDAKMIIEAHSESSYRLYELLMGEEIDLSRELSRMSLPVNIYTEMVWKIDLHNLFKFLKARADGHAQFEIRVYAKLLEEIVASWVPMAFSAYRVYRRDALSFSAYEAEIIVAALVHPDGVKSEEQPMWADKLSSREWKAFVEKIIKIT